MDEHGNALQIFNRIGSHFDHWDTSLVTGLQLDCLPLITLHWVCPFGQFSMHLTLWH